eukprot:scaffold239678_cov23-Tisochrysis_lutea.AAC.1
MEDGALRGTEILRMLWQLTKKLCSFQKEKDLKVGTKDEEGASACADEIGLRFDPLIVSRGRSTLTGVLVRRGVCDSLSSAVKWY